MEFSATEFEFRHRFWIISGIFAVGFGCYRWDHTNVSVAMARMLLDRGISGNSPQVDHYARAILVAGTLIVTVGALIRSWAGAYLHSSVVHDTKLHLDRLVADGPYRYVRNPLYLGIILLAAGMGLMASRWGFLVLAAGMPLFTYRLIRREETSLLETQGERYRAFVRSVPRLLPSLRPRVPPGTGEPDWTDGLAGERFMWGFAIGMAVFAVTLRFVYFGLIIGAGFGSYFIQILTRKESG